MIISDDQPATDITYNKTLTPQEGLCSVWPNSPKSQSRHRRFFILKYPKHWQCSFIHFLFYVVRMLFLSPGQHFVVYWLFCESLSNAVSRQKVSDISEREMWVMCKCLLTWSSPNLAKSAAFFTGFSFLWNRGTNKVFSVSSKVRFMT